MPITRWMRNEKVQKWLPSITYTIVYSLLAVTILYVIMLFMEGFNIGDKEYKDASQAVIECEGLKSKRMIAACHMAKIDKDVDPWLFGLRYVIYHLYRGIAMFIRDVSGSAITMVLTALITGVVVFYFMRPGRQENFLHITPPHILNPMNWVRPNDDIREKVL